MAALVPYDSTESDETQKYDGNNIPDSVHSDTTVTPTENEPCSSSTESITLDWSSDVICDVPTGVSTHYSVFP